MGVAQQQPQVQIQTRVSRLNHQSRAENNTSNRVTSSPLSLSTNDSTSTTSIGISSSQDSVFDCREYEVDLILSAALIGDKEEYAYDDQAEDAATSAQVNSQSQNNERYAMHSRFTCKTVYYHG